MGDEQKQLLAYLQTINKELAAGNATEHTHRTALKSLIESIGDKITATIRRDSGLLTAIPEKL